MAKRKNFLPTLIITLLSWIGFIYIIFFQSPSSPLFLTTFYLLLFLSLFLTLSLILTNSRRGLLISLFIIFYLLLRYFKVATFLNTGLLLAVLFSLELYRRKK